MPLDVRLSYFGGAAWDSGPLPARGRGQEALLLRLAVDAGTVVGYRALGEDVWPDDPPASPRAALQSLVSRLRRALPEGLIEAAPGGYRLALPRDAVDLTRFQDLANEAAHADPAAAAAQAYAALQLWRGDPVVPDGFDWLIRDLLDDRARLERIVRGTSAPSSTAASSARDTQPPADSATQPPAGPSPTLGPRPSDPASPPASPSVPAALTTIVGRDHELDLVAAQLDAERLVTLIGPGGAGKTTLALETARRRPGAIVVELAPAAAGEVWSAVAGAVGRSIRFEASTATGSRERALEALAGRAILLVLDNCEHVSREAAEVAADLLRSVPAARILATSREPLGVPVEAFVDLGPLPDVDATELFARRVRAARGTAPDATESDAVDRIVRRLDGLPLALELAAAKTRTLSLAEIDEGLDDRFALLATGPRAADPRHQTLRALIDWSWETLTEPERTALLTASVFPDGIGTADAVAVARHTGTDAAAFDALVDRSLLHRADGRFRMLETVREYGLDRLRASGDLERARLRGAAAVAELAQLREPLLRGPRVREALTWYDANEENVSAALRAAESSGERELGARVLRGVLWAWSMRERFPELSDGLMAFGSGDVPLDSEAAVVVNGVALLMTSFLAAVGGAPSPEVAASFHERAPQLIEAAAAHPSELALVLPPLLRAVAQAIDAPDPRASRMWGLPLEEVDDPDAPEWTQALLAVLRTAFAQNSGDVDTLGAESERALARFRELGDVWGTALASQMRSEWLMLHGRLAEALAVSDAGYEGLVGLTSTSDLMQQRSASIGILARLGRVDEARARTEEMAEVAQRDGSARALLQYRLTAAGLDVAIGDGDAALVHLAAPELTLPTGGPEDQIRSWADARRAQAHLLCGQPEEAGDALRRALPLALSSGDQPIIAEAVLTLAAWLAAVGRRDDARRAFGQSVRLRGRRDETDPLFLRVQAALGAPPAVADGAAGDAELDELMALLDA